MVWPKFRSSRMPSSRGSWLTIELFTCAPMATAARSAARSPASMRSSPRPSCATDSRSNRNALFTTSARPDESCRGGSDVRTDTSAKTASGKWNAPTRFFPAAMSTAVLPPIEASAIPRSVVGICAIRIPLHVERDVDVGVGVAPFREDRPCALARPYVLIRPFRHGGLDARGNAVDRAAQPDDEAEVPHDRAIGLTDRCATAGIDDHPRRRWSKLGENARLEVTEAVHSFLLDDVLAALARPPLDLAVEVDHGGAEVAREERRHRGLADARRTDQEQVHQRRWSIG